MPRPEAEYTVARMLHHLGKNAESRLYLQQALQANPNLAGGRELLACLDGRDNGRSLPVVNLTFAVDDQGTNSAARQ
jgi:hypothetical protein